MCRTTRFQSTLPARGATLGNWDDINKAYSISIHAPRTGSDASDVALLSGINNFNPRSPHGERHLCKQKLIFAIEFQSTLPARGATL